MFEARCIYDARLGMRQGELVDVSDESLAHFGRLRSMFRHRTEGFKL